MNRLNLYGNLEPGTWNAKWRKRGFTLVELAVAISVIAVLAAVLLNRLAYYKELAEKAAMESMVRIIKTGLQIRLAELIITNRQARGGDARGGGPDAVAGRTGRPTTAVLTASRCSAARGISMRWNANWSTSSIPETVWMSTSGLTRSRSAFAYGC